MAAPSSSPMRRRTIGMTVIVVAAIAVVIWWQRRERMLEATPPVEADATGSAAPAVAPPPVKETMRKIDSATRTALLDRIRTARASRGGSAAVAPNVSSSSSSSSPRPTPPLPGKLEPSEIRKAVRDVIPLLAECYDNALPRLAVKEGKIVVNMKLVGEPEVGTLIESAEIAGDEGFTRDAELMECFQQTMMAIELPPTTEGHEVHVTYPMAFSPGS